MLAAFFETFIWAFAIFVLLEIALRATGFSIQEHSEEEKLVHEFEEALVLVKVEQIKDIFYLYNVQSEDFVGQAKTQQDLEDISERLQKHIVIVDGDDNVIKNLKKLNTNIHTNIVNKDNRGY